MISLSREERLERYLRAHLVVNQGVDLSREVEEILAIADDRAWASIQDFADHIGRERTSLLTWISRGLHDIPEPVMTTRSGQLWDAREVHEWAESHRRLCHSPEERRDAERAKRRR